MTTDIQHPDPSTSASESPRASFRTSVMDNASNRPLSSYQPEEIEVETKNLNLYYGKKQALFDVSIVVPRKRVTAFIGPSGCGKSTLLRTFNRMNDLIEGCHIDGQIIQKPMPQGHHSIIQSELSIEQMVEFGFVN